MYGNVVAGVAFVVAYSAVVVFSWFKLRLARHNAAFYETLYENEQSEKRRRIRDAVSSRLRAERAEKEAEHCRSMFEESVGKIQALRTDLADARRAVGELSAGASAVGAELGGVMGTLISTLRGSTTGLQSRVAEMLVVSDRVDWSGCDGVDPRPLEFYHVGVGGGVAKQEQAGGRGGV